MNKWTTIQPNPLEVSLSVTPIRSPFSTTSTRTDVSLRCSASPLNYPKWLLSWYQRDTTLPNRPIMWGTHPPALWSTNSWNYLWKLVSTPTWWKRKGTVAYPSHAGLLPWCRSYRPRPKTYCRNGTNLIKLPRKVQFLREMPPAHNLTSLSSPFASRKGA